MSERAMRPFWIHQLAEYLIGIALVSQGLQDPQPLVPTIAGTVVIANAAAVRGPLGAFKFIGRGAHRWLDIVVMALMAAAALQPWIDVSGTGRGMMLVILLPLGFLWFYTDWAERTSRKERRLAAAGTGGGGEQVGRVAGRLAGNAYSTAKTVVKNRQK